MKKNRNKRLITVCILTCMLLPLNACGKQGDITASEEPEQQITEQVSTEETAEIFLTNQMTENELSRVSKHELTLLDEPTEDSDKAEWDPTGHTVAVEEKVRLSGYIERLSGNGTRHSIKKSICPA